MSRAGCADDAVDASAAPADSSTSVRAFWNAEDDNITLTITFLRRSTDWFGSSVSVLDHLTDQPTASE